MKTMNSGYHYYYTVSDKQKEFFRSVDFHSSASKLFGMSIDVKYTNQIFFGPSVLTYGDEVIRSYYIINEVAPRRLPLWLFQEMRRTSPNPNATEEPIITIPSDSKTTKTKSKVNTNVAKESKPIVPLKRKTFPMLRDETTDATLRNYCNCLNLDRFDNYDDWFKLGAIIYNEGGSPELFHEFSAKSSKYDKSDVDAKWAQYYTQDSPTKHQLSIGTLHFWAKQDSPNEYKKLIKTDKNHILFKIATLGIQDEYVVDLFQQYYPNAWMHTPLSTHLYHLNSFNIWIEDVRAFIVRNVLIKELLPKVKKYYDNFKYQICDAYIQNNTKGTKRPQYQHPTILDSTDIAIANAALANTTNIVNSTALTEQVKQLQKMQAIQTANEKAQDHVSNLLAKVHKRNLEYIAKTDFVGVVERIKLAYVKHKIDDKIDNTNNYLFAFDNGVINLKTCEFGLPSPQDYVTKTCGFNYEPINDEIKPIMTRIMQLVRSMMPNEEDVTYLLKTIAQNLSARADNEEFYIWQGQGGNGKGLLASFIEETFGSYHSPMDIEYLTQKPNSGNSTGLDPVLANKRNSRIVITTEPESGVTLKTAKLKLLSSKDKVECRAMYKDPFSYHPKFKVFIQTNYDLKVDASCIATKRQLRILEFPYLFVENPTEPNQRQRDITLKNQIKDNPLFKIAFFHVLLEYYKKIYEDSPSGCIPMSENVKYKTNDLLGENDTVTPFITAKLIITKIKTDRISASILYEEFRKFCINDTSKLVDRPRFKSMLLQKGITSLHLEHGNVYLGVKFKPDDANDEEADDTDNDQVN